MPAAACRPPVALWPDPPQNGAMRIREFGVETWMNRWETRCRFNLAETCVESLAVGQLLELADIDGSAFLAELRALKLTYGAIEGTDRLRDAIAALYLTVRSGDVVVAHGAIGANHLVYEALVEPGDRVISIVPTYQQHTSIPESLGAEVVPLALREADGWRLDLPELRRLAAGGAKLIALANPNNPTGALLDEAGLREVAAIADAAGAWVLCDEVYRGIDQAGSGTTPSIADLYPRGIAVGSMSKAFSLAGLRLGWIAAPAEVTRAVTVHRDYNTISVGMVDDLLAAIALEHRDAILARNRAIVRGNLTALDAWVAGEPSISFVRPQGGTIALLRYAFDLPSEALCISLLEERGVMFTPGSALDMEGYLRIGYANSPRVLEDGLAETSAFLEALEARG
jgi:aspartate/methionine/tyrosine aminotransferase